jgi:DNA-binding protein HU-beta
MNQGDLADAVAEATGAKRAEAARGVEALLDAIRDGLKRGEKVAISGFGSFEAARREARQGRNPRTGEAVEVPASTTVRFKPGKGLKDALNGGGALAARFSR